MNVILLTFFLFHAFSFLHLYPDLIHNLFTLYQIVSCYCQIAFLIVIQMHDMFIVYRVHLWSFEGILQAKWNSLHGNQQWVSVLGMCIYKCMFVCVSLSRTHQTVERHASWCATSIRAVVMAASCITWCTASWSPMAPNGHSSWSHKTGATPLVAGKQSLNLSVIHAVTALAPLLDTGLVNTMHNHEQLLGFSLDFKTFNLWK